MNDYVIELCVVYIGVKFLKTQSDKAVVCFSVSLSTVQVTSRTEHLLVRSSSLVLFIMWPALVPT